MKTSNKIAIVMGILTPISTIIAAVIGVNYGKDIEQKNIQNQIEVIGNENDITINNTRDLIDDYLNIRSQNESLQEQNTKYFNDMLNANNRIEELDLQIDNMPIFDYNNLGLCINAEDIPINQNNSMIRVDGKEYFSKEIVEHLLSEDENMTIKDDTIFIGRVIANKENLIAQKEVDHNGRCSFFKSKDDSYGNTHTDGILLNNDGSIIYNLDRKFSMLDISLSIASDAMLDQTGVISIKADDEIVYTSNQLTKKTEPFTIKQIPINNCSLLTIEYNGNYNNQCILSDGIVYN